MSWSLTSQPLLQRLVILSPEDPDVLSISDLRRPNLCATCPRIVEAAQAAKRYLHGLLVACLLLVAPRVAGAQSTAITAGTLIDPEAGTATANQIILIEAGRIKAIGSALPVPENATRIDLSRETVLPASSMRTRTCSQTSTRNGICARKHSRCRAGSSEYHQTRACTASTYCSTPMWPGAGTFASRSSARVPGPSPGCRDEI
jgi:hypothetical protein